MYILGISSGIKHGHHDGAAVLLRGGELVAAAEEERFTLAKHARGELPRQAIRYCLRQAGIGIRDVGHVCSPLKSYPHYARRIGDWLSFHFGHSPKVDLFDHHLCHAASAYYGSGFAEATVVCLDFSGDSSSGLVACGKDGELRELRRFDRTNSLGLYYGMITQYLGFQMTNDEYKVMGLASYGQPERLDAFDRILRPDGLGYTLEGGLDKRRRDQEIYTSDFSTRQEQIFTEELEAILGPRRMPGSPIEPRHMDVAASAQKRLEQVATALVEEAVAATGCRDLCMAGGVALNCKMNGELKRLPAIRNLYVPPVPHDPGVALGAAMLCARGLGNTVQPLRHAYWGPEYAPGDIRATLTRVGARFEEPADIVEACAGDLVAGRKIAWFQGRMEFGPRALGNRSIIGDPGRTDMKEAINATIKYREGFRPLCPSVLDSAQARLFDDPTPAPFMVVTYSAGAAAAQCIPAAVHVDGTARLQTVTAATNPLYHRLISAFEAQGGAPALVNTSLNINEQPMVNAPIEALHTFFCSGLDVCYLGPFRLTKA